MPTWSRTGCGASLWTVCPSNRRRGAGPRPVTLTRHRHYHFGAVRVTNLLTMAAVGGLLVTACVSNPPSSAPDQLTPLVPSVLAAPQWFTGSDGRVHLVYEVELVNGFSFPVDLTSVVVADGATGEELGSFAGAVLLAIMTPLGAVSATSASVPGSSVAILWMDLALDPRDELPASIRHTYTLGLPDGIPLPRSVEYAIPWPPQSTSRRRRCWPHRWRALVGWRSPAAVTDRTGGRSSL